MVLGGLSVKGTPVGIFTKSQSSVYKLNLEKRKKLFCGEKHLVSFFRVRGQREVWRAQSAVSKKKKNFY